MMRSGEDLLLHAGGRRGGSQIVQRRSFLATAIAALTLTGSPGMTGEESVPPAAAAATAGDLLAGIEALGKKLPPERYDVGARAAALPTLEAAFAFLRDRVELQAYRGILRGPQGTLAAGAGNSWDRSLLLRALLAARKTEVRLARAELDDAAADRLLERVLRGAPQAGPGGRETETVAAARRTAARLVALAGEALAGDRAAATPGELREELRDHAWLQARVDGKWIDLDPSLGSLRLGETIAAAGETFPAPPEDRFQMVELQVIASHGPEDPEPRDFLDVKARAAELAASDLGLAFLPESQGKPGAAGALERLRAKGRKVTPVLFLGETEVRGKPFPVPDRDAPEDGGAGAFFFGDDDAPKGPLARVELAVTLRIPGAEPRAFLRTLYDRDRAPPGGVPADRPPGGIPAELADVHAIVVSVGPADLEAFLGAARGLPGFLAEVLAALDAKEPAGLPIAYQLWPLSIAARTLDVLASHRAAPLAGAGGVRLQQDAPRVILVSQGLRAGAAGKVEAALVTDLLADDLRLVAPPDSPLPAAAGRQVLYGVLEGFFEGAYAAGAAPPGKEGRGRWGSAAAIPLEDLRPIGADEVPSIALAGADEDLLRRALEGGDRIFGSPGRKGVWWQVSAATGRTRAVLAPSLGGSYAFGAGEVLREGARAAARGAAPEAFGPGTTWHIRELADGRILSASEADLARARAGRFARPRPTPRGGGGNVMGEYLLLMLNVSIPASVAASVIGSVTAAGAVFAYLAIARELRAGPFAEE